MTSTVRIRTVKTRMVRIQYDPYGQQYQQPDQYGQPMMVPVGFFLQKTPEQLAGEKAARDFHGAGIISLACMVTLSWWLFGLPSLILVLSVFSRRTRQSVMVWLSAGRILNWISVAIGGMFLMLFGGVFCWRLCWLFLILPQNSELVETQWHSSKTFTLIGGYPKARSSITRERGFAVYIRISRGLGP